MDSHVPVQAVYSEARGRIVDYLGSHEHLAVDMDLSVDEGGLRLRSGAQRFYEGPIGFNFPMLFSGVADVPEWFDETAQRFRIIVDIRTKPWVRCSAIAEASTQSGGRSPVAKTSATCSRTARSVASNGNGRWRIQRTDVLFHPTPTDRTLADGTSQAGSKERRVRSFHGGPDPAKSQGPVPRRCSLPPLPRPLDQRP